ncbi:MAG: N-acetylglucosamine kinase [Terriglobales bacterium]
MALFLGIDGGGTKTTCAVGDETLLRATATVGGSAMLRVPADQARSNLRNAVIQCCKAAGVDPSHMDAAVVGVSGASVPNVVDAVRSTVRELVSCEVAVVSDIAIALEAAFAGGPGIVVIAGTGSIATGRNAAGHLARSGGWGRVVSDEGSAYWIAKRAVAAALEEHECGRDVLLRDILAAWKLTGPEELIKIANAAPAPNFAELFPQLVRHGAAEAALTAIFHEAGEALASLVQNVKQRLWRPHDRMRVAITGGVFEHAPEVQRLFADIISRDPEVELVPGLIEPVRGALWMAARVSGRELRSSP